jgi:diaminohydroxyphosphoribosylaminopyrimidine deaminase/5-amino-6-(5-phosphoribosylamino)uracil reductase
VQRTTNGNMQLAIDKAWRYQFLTYPNPAVGATIVKDGEVLAVEAHYKAGDPHAEVNACRAAFLQTYPNAPLKNLTASHTIHDYLIQNHNGFFNDCEIFVTLEPCNHTGKTPACAHLLKKLKFKKVYIGSLDPNYIATGGKEALEAANIDVEIGVLEDQCDQLLRPFRLWQHQKFTFFKLAIREDGSCDGGYITTQDSLNFVHEIRSKLDLLIIGGETVRVDRPTLDSRFAKENNPSDILILSQKKEFDPTIPLFHVPNRSVTIDSTLKGHIYNFSMIEGGYNFLKLFHKQIDMLMLFISHQQSSESPFEIESLGFKKIYSYFINDLDEVVFCLPK